METILIFLEVLLFSIISQVLIILFQTKALDWLCDQQKFKELVEKIAAKKYKTEVRASFNGHGFCVFNKNHKHGQQFETKENWYYKVVIGNKWFRR